MNVNKHNRISSEMQALAKNVENKIHGMRFNKRPLTESEEETWKRAFARIDQLNDELRELAKSHGVIV